MSIAPLANPVNRLLALLPPKVSGRILNDVTLVDLTFGSALWKQGDRMRHVHFPATGFISLLTTVDEHTFEVGMVGDEGMCGQPNNPVVEKLTGEALFLCERRPVIVARAGTEPQPKPKPHASHCTPGTER